MISGATTFSQVLIKIWRKLTAASQYKKDRGVFLHDPAAERPHDLDDPFFDNKAQARIGKAIANATQTKHGEPEARALTSQR